MDEISRSALKCPVCNWTLVLKGSPEDSWSLICPHCDNSWHGGPDDWQFAVDALNRLPEST